MKILLVEDDEFVCELISGHLSKLGHDVLITRDGDEALEKVKNFDFDLLITDILMPKKDGIELIQEVRNTRSEIKILAISSAGKTGWSSFLKLAETVGADMSLQKPFSALQLTQKIDELTAPNYIRTIAKK